MTENNDNPEQTPEPAAPTPNEVDTTLSPAHPVDENPEEHIGDETPDPWNDEDQTDWPNAHTDSDLHVEDENGEPTDG